MNIIKGREFGNEDLIMPLREEIEDYIKEILDGEIRRIPFKGYRLFRDLGSRQESDTAYFQVRKQLTALGTYLTWTQPDAEIKDYFNELLWSVANEFTWCLAAHLPYEKHEFINAGSHNIDLFASETAATLAE